MNKVYNFQEQINTSSCSIDLIASIPDYYDIYYLKGSHYGRISLIQTINDIIFIQVDNDFCEYSIIVRKKCELYKRLINLLNSKKNLIDLTVKLTLEVYFGFLAEDDEPKYDILTNLQVLFSNSLIRVPTEVFNFLIENRYYVFDITLLHYELENDVYNLFKNYRLFNDYFDDEYDFLFDIDRSEKDNKRTGLPFELKKWELLLKEEDTDTEKWLEDKLKFLSLSLPYYQYDDKKWILENHAVLPEEESGEETLLDDSDYYSNDIETLGTDSLRDAGIIYDEDSDLYFQDDGDHINFESPVEYSEWQYEIDCQENEEQYRMIFGLLSDFFYNNKMFSKERWEDGLCNIISDEIIYYLLLVDNYILENNSSSKRKISPDEILDEFLG